MILPDRCSIMDLLTSWASSKAAVRLTDTMESHWSRPNSSTSASKAMPAQLTRMSTEPSVSAQRRTTAAGTPGCVMSATMNSIRPPASSISRRVVPSSSARPTANTAAPALARATEKARPRPVLPPVTRALRPARENRSRLKSAMSMGPLPSKVGSGPGVGIRLTSADGRERGEQDGEAGGGDVRGDDEDGWMTGGRRVVTGPDGGRRAGRAEEHQGHAQAGRGEQDSAGGPGQAGDGGSQVADPDQQA